MGSEKKNPPSVAKVNILWLNRLKNEDFLHIEALWSTSLLKLVRVTKPEGQSGLGKLIREYIRPVKVMNQHNPGTNGILSPSGSQG